MVELYVSNFMKWINNAYNKTFFSKMKRRLSKRILFDGIKQIHVEHYFYDDVWGLIKSFPKPSRVTWYVTTPADYDLVKNLCQVEEKSKLDSKMSIRVKWMNKNDYPLGLHIHFHRRGNMPTNKKRKMFAEALSWGKKNGILFRKFVPGWFNYTKDLKSLCDSFNLRLVGKEPHIHDFDLQKYKMFF